MAEMTIAQTDNSTPRKPLRLWPGVLAAALLLLVRFVIPIVVPGAGGTAILGGLAGGLAIIVWWLFFSQAHWSERVGAIVIMVGAVLATSRIVHESIANGMMGMMLPIFAIPVLSLALVASAAASRRLSNGPRRAAMAAAILLASGGFATGDRRWIGPARGGGYSSPHLLMIDGVAQILLMSAAGATSVAPADGTLLWEHPWPGMPIVQPAQIADGALLISTADAMGGNGTRRIAVAHGPGGWTVEERWTSNGLKPYFNDFVVHKGHAFGFDGSILACIDLEDGKRKWKGGRYGNGQLVLLPDQDLLLVLSEDGELALVGAATDQFREIARFQALEGKTWNHPVLVGDVLLVRNGEEMAAFRLSLAGR
ncbi:MAG TPA: hypothetical protein VGZ27_07710 [Vicinamibacterales bacterium]|jgi:hypothetical protein|nr:hypothetical protein [Vicinamibacterales bacterium]